jgi:replicative DNA helicase
MTIEELFEFNEFIEAVEKDTFIDLKYKCYIDTPNGIKPIRKLVKKLPEDWVIITLENGIKSIVSLHHKYVINNKVIFAKDLKIGDYLETKDGLIKIKNIEIQKNENEYLYGLSLDSPHLYYDANGILHHNTALIINSTANFLLRQKNVIYFTLEMAEEEIAKRLDANLLNVKINDLKNLSFEEYKRKFESLGKLGHLRIKEYPAGTLNTTKIKSYLKKLQTKDGFKPDVIVIDYLGLMSSSRISLAKAGSYQYYKSISEEVHALSKELDIPILTAFQLNRSAYNNTEAGMENISDSIGVVQTADVILAILSNEKMREEKQVLLKFLKNRLGGYLTSHLVKFEPEYSRFTDLEQNEEYTEMIEEKINEETNLNDLVSDVFKI